MPFTETSEARIAKTVLDFENRNNPYHRQAKQRHVQDGNLPHWDVILNADIAAAAWGEVELLKTDRNTRSGQTVQAFNYGPAQLDEDTKAIIVPVAMEGATDATGVRWFIVYPSTTTPTLPVTEFSGAIKASTGTGGLYGMQFSGNPPTTIDVHGGAATWTAGATVQAGDLFTLKKSSTFYWVSFGADIEWTWALTNPPPSGCGN